MKMKEKLRSFDFTQFDPTKPLPAGVTERVGVHYEDARTDKPRPVPMSRYFAETKAGPLRVDAGMWIARRNDGTIDHVITDEAFRADFEPA